MKKRLKSIVSVLLTAAMIVTLPVGANTSTVKAEEGVAISAANFPDSTFRRFIKKNYDIDKNNVLSASEISLVIRMNVSNKKISDLTGIKYFSELRYLDCRNLGLTSLDIADLSMLRELNCSGNQLASLDVGSTYYVFWLDCSNNQLSALDVSGCNIYYLNCSKNKLTELELYSSNNLKVLDCSENQINYLDLTGIEELLSLNCSDNPIYAVSRISAAKNSALQSNVNVKVNLTEGKYVAQMPEFMYEMTDRIIAQSSGTLDEDGNFAWNRLSEIPSKMTYTVYVGDDFYSDMSESEMSAAEKMTVTAKLSYAGESSIKLSNSKLTLKAGKQKTLKMKGTNEKITWKSSKKSVATVNSNGVVKAKRKGKATITATIGAITRKCVVTVQSVPKKK